MAFSDMIGRLNGEIPKLSAPQVRQYINEALGLIFDSQMWSFQLKNSGWFTPGLVAAAGVGQSIGGITVNTYDDTVVGNAAASAAWLSLTGRPLLTELQIRVPYYALYDIISVDSTDPNAVVLTLDRPWMEPPQVAGPYMLYQAYFPAPAADFKRFFAVRDTTNAWDLTFGEYSQNDLARLDPQRTIFNIPSQIIPYDQDTRPNSATLGYQRYELWPGPLTKLPYSISYLRRGDLLSKRDDTVPYPLTDELVQWRALEVACLYKERQKGEDVARGSGTDWKFSAQAAHDEYKALFKVISNKDRAAVELYFTRLRLTRPRAPFATINSQLNVGTF